jgi:hypothetical protein
LGNISGQIQIKQQFLNLNYLIMRRATKTSEETRNLEMLLSVLSENEKLNLQAMSSVRGGDGEANGSVPIVIIPEPPK